MVACPGFVLPCREISLKMRRFRYRSAKIIWGLCACSISLNSQGEGTIGLKTQMTRRVYITGASGTGVSTLGRALAQALHAPHADVDDFYWLPTDPPFSQKRRVADRLKLLRRALGDDGWVLSGSFDSWGEPLLARVDLVIFVSVPTGIRMARLRTRERNRFGARIEKGGDMAAIHAGFMAWASRYDDPDFLGRNRAQHEDWLQSLRCPVLRLDGTMPTADQVQAVLDHPALEPSFA